jgi:hypothetical protein
MRKIPISQARAGQIVRRPVHGASGALLCQPGTQLSDILIERLQNFGVEVLVVDAGGDAVVPFSATAAGLDERFAGHEQDELMMALKRVVASQLAS